MTNMTTQTIDRTTLIRETNDDFRQTFLGGKVMLTRAIAGLDPVKRVALLNEVRNFTAFDPEDDPYGEHDFGAFLFDGRQIFWKIDLYDKALEFGSPDPTDPAVTSRVLTIMTAAEY